MGAAEGHARISHASGRFAAYSDAARSALKRFPHAIEGATAIEYATIASLISIVIVTGVASIGQTIKSYFMEMIVPFL
jgi:Flp pilus assembly pilin Flp